jgi:hypothetical protein
MTACVARPNAQDSIDPDIVGTDRSPWAPLECNLGPISQNCDRTPQMERWLELLHIGWMKI